MRTRCGRSECGADEGECGWQIVHDELGADTDDAKAAAAELQIAARIRAALASVNGAIDFDDEVAARSAEVCDELDGDRHLAAKKTPSLAGVERGSQERFRLGEGRAMLPSEEFEPRE